METKNLKLNNKHKGVSLFEKLVLKALLALPLGKLVITMPNGEIIKIGNGKGKDIEANIQINNTLFFRKGALFGDIGFAESYIDGDWETDNLTNVISYFILNHSHASFISGSKVKQIGINIFRWVNKTQLERNINSIEGSRKNIAKHYDLGNDFYKLWLDETMTYSCAYFPTDDLMLEEAQYRKYERLGGLLQLKPTDTVLEIGTGWGSNAVFMAQKYGCKVQAVTISESQYEYASRKVKDLGLENKVQIQLIDYRKIEGKFDKIVSVEMLEAVGINYFDNFFSICNKLLKENGLLALQVITCPDSRFKELNKNPDFIRKHVFPGSNIPSVAAINTAINRTSDLTLIDLKDLGQYYAKTLKMWHLNFTNNIDKIEKLGYSNEFMRKWNYYLCYCEAAFAMRNINVMQMLYSRPNNFDLK